ncbi:ubiquitin-conjugating enzyme [Tupanvirus deep ocean]|uniref:Ubiquitin-conjugating enzyme n=2 Tax=Tupanvirus TaxID=2094720 RepID=A0AC62A9S4_9VIRU|nr:ubiquitin-conjugating enzyme [Tupanvirus deep ocean]QKU34532.1 ubiquitin-conjugating enzyme [Tupanvirus deep ocean]
MQSTKINLRSNAIKRIMKDLNENNDHPVNGISICMPSEDDIFTLHCNVKIMNGIYKDIILHLIMHIPDDYPHTGPAMNIAPGIPFGHKFHEHVYDDGYHGNTICNDLLTNFKFFFEGRREVASGWSPGYTLNTILMQMSLFFEDPDLPKHLLPSLTDIEKLKSRINDFRCDICGHTTDNPYPPVVSEAKDIVVDIAKEQLLEKVTCSVSKSNIFNDKNLILGCPLDVRLDRFGRIWAVPILETISYETYIGEIQKYGIEKLESYSRHYFTSALGQKYNFWMPYYLTKEHFERGYQTIINAISVIKHGTASGESRFDFKPTDALDVLLSLCNKTVVNILNGKMHESKAAIEGYVHFLRLLMEFITRFPVLQQKINITIENFVKNRAQRNKSKVPDIGEFIITLFLSKYKYDNIKKELLEEYFARQIFWLLKNGVDLSEPNINKRLQDCFESSKVSCHLLVFNLQMAKTFIFDGVKDKLDAHYGFAPDHIVDSFQNQIKQIKSEVNSYPRFLKRIGFSNVIRSPEHMIEYLEQAELVSRLQGYTK